MKVRLLLTVASMVLLTTLAIRVKGASEASPGPHRENEAGNKFDCDKEPCGAVARGFRAFLDRRLQGLGGNGRACADCHMPSESFQLSPAAARERFERLLSRREHHRHADDPLFRPVDADDFRVNGDNATDFSN